MLSRVSQCRHGNSLIEFSFVALALYLLLAGAIEMGRALHAAQALQQAADAGARELAKVRLPVAATLSDALYSADPTYQEVRTRIFNEDYLVVDITGTDIATAFQNAPILNQQLMPLMIVEQVGATTYLRYPGALLTKAETKTGLTVGIPIITSRAGDGAESIDMVPVVEEIPASDGTSQFSFLSAASTRGLVALRINYPFQAASLSAYQNPGFPPEPAPPIGAHDDEVTVNKNTTGGTVGSGGTTIGTYAGPYGLGTQLAFGKTLRPFRRTLSAQSIGYRRELSF